MAFYTFSLVFIASSAIIKVHINVWSLAIPVTCDAGRFNNGSKASVTCNLKDVTRRLSVSLVHHVNISEETEHQAMSCIQSTSARRLLCVVKEGYEFDYVNLTEIPASVTVNIPVVTPQFDGHYSCQVITDVETEVHLCTLSVKVTNTTGTYNDEPQSIAFPYQAWRPNSIVKSVLTVTVAVLVPVASVLAIIVWLQCRTIKALKKPVTMEMKGGNRQQRHKHEEEPLNVEENPVTSETLLV